MILFSGLWTLADREGRLEDRPKRIKAQIFPYMDVHLDTLMDTLGQKHFISRYSVDGQKYVQIHNWHRHQKPHHTEKESVIPLMDTLTDSSPLKDGEYPEGNGLMGNGLMGNGDKAKCAERFNKFWEAYPRKVKKLRAVKAWNKIKPDEELFGEIMAGLESYLAGEWKGLQRHFIPHPSSWLNEKQWKDEVLGPRNNGNKPTLDAERDVGANTWLDTATDEEKERFHETQRKLAEQEQQLAEGKGEA